MPVNLRKSEVSENVDLIQRIYIENKVRINVLIFTGNFLLIDEVGEGGALNLC